MACLIKFKLKDKVFEYETKLKPEEINLEKIAEEILDKEIAVKDKGDLNIPLVISLQLAKSKSITEGIKGVLSKIIDSLENGVRIVGNYNLDSLSGRFNIDFGKLKLNNNEEILFTKSLSYDGIGIGGRIALDDKYVFVITGDYDARKMANFLNIRLKLLNEKIDIKSLASEKVITCLNYIAEHGGPKDLQKALLHFFNNSSKYLYKIAGEDIDIFTTLSDFIKEKINDQYVRTTLDNPVANTIMHMARYRKMDSCYLLSKSQLSKILLMYNIKHNLKLDEKIDSKNSSDQEIIDFLDTLLSDAGHPMLIDFSRQFIKLKSPYNTMSILDFLYDDILAAVRDPNASKFGLNVYKVKDKAFVTRDKRFTLDSHVIQFSSVEEAKEYVNKLIKRTSIAAGYRRPTISSNLFKKDSGQIFIYDPQQLNFSPLKDSVFSALNYDFDSRKSLTELLNPIFLKKRYKIGENLLSTLDLNILDFRNILLNEYEVNKEDVSKIDTFEKAIAVLAEASKSEITEDNINSVMQNAVQTIGNIETGDFIILLKRSGNGYNQLVISRVDDNIYNEEEYKPLPPPIIVPLTNLANKINMRFRTKTGINDNLVNIITVSDIDENNFGLKDAKVNRNSSGFILNGRIFINASYAHYNDLIHECGHLLLGMMKATDMNMYMKLMQNVSDMAEIVYIKSKKAQLDEYKYLADEDLTEEAFVDLFGKYILRNNTELAMSDAGLTIKRHLSLSLKEFGTLLEGAVSLENLFSNFNTATKDILFEGNGLELSEAVADRRRATNFIAKELEKGNDSLIKMTCE